MSTTDEPDSRAPSAPRDDWLEQHFDALRAALAGHRDAACRQVRVWGAQLADTYAHGGRLLACGNGGSAAEAQHLTAELTGRFRRERRPLSAIALHADSSSTTAIVNDYGPEEMFARQVRAHGRPGDVLVTLSTSGASANVVAAAKAGQDLGLRTWALTGPSPNPLAALCDDAIAIEDADVPTVQEMHLVLVHALCATLDETLVRWT
ncbi:D-sedoheptulose-7-phosphate isomerase [Nocardia sp. X0981]